MRLIRTLVPLSLTAMASFAQEVHYNYDHSVNFGRYRSYRWVEVDGALRLDQLTEKLLKNAVDVELSNKGLSRIMGNDPDLLISYQAAINHEQQFNAFSGGFGPGWGYGPDWGRGWGYVNYGTSTITVQSTPIHAGSLGFDIYDADQKKLIWRGEATNTIDVQAKPEKRQSKIEKGVAKLLKNYPPRPSK